MGTSDILRSLLDSMGKVRLPEAGLAPVGLDAKRLVRKRVVDKF